jgi:citrate lyase subunit beta / citryl-CoA lyase
MMRSMLFVPADSERKLAKAAAAGADALILDLEDSVAPERKPQARGLVKDYLKNPSGKAAHWVRVNDLHSGELRADLTAVVPLKPAGIVLPKILGPEDIHSVAKELADLERSSGLPAAGISILALVTETPAALLRTADLLHEPSPRLKALSWGGEDLSSALGAGNPRLPNGAWRPMYEYARLQCILAAHALGIEALDTVYVDYRDSAGLRAASEASRYDGFTGRLAIHPDQVPVINAAFTPSEAELILARRIVDAFAAGAGVVSIDGKMYDKPHLTAARRVLENTQGNA